MRSSSFLIIFFLAACSSRKIPLKTTEVKEAVSNHPKDRSLAYFRQLVEQHRNKELSRQVTLLTSKGFKPSNEYTALFLGGQCLKTVCTYVYQVSVDFYKTQDERSDFQAVSAILSTRTTAKTPRIKQILSSHQILKLLD